MKTAASALLISATILLGSYSFAADNATRTQRIEVRGVEEIEIEGGVGSMDIERAAGTEMLIELEIKAERGWFGRRRNIDDIDLEIIKRGDRLIVKVNEQDLDDIELHWHVQLPEVDRTSINLGVGQIIAEVGNTELRVDLGVGEAKIRAPLAHAGRVEASAGVGSASISGANDLVSNRAFVSESVYGYGNSTKRIEVNVGVGDVVVQLSSN
ncbi:MAG: hypothetical protein Q8L60_05480 [Gammaproteobacteria bacterium]|nr:hypothetical protein [Gammaproteobacteria bacterium]MDP2140544.1 hypothetical protein [Gammaproteobacteria bacterium]MDP2347313.1 hypothetical protein [Gammaproteobacteria bacterium]